MYGKLDGKANMENKYDFPPPVDKKLYFGACAVVGLVRDDSNNVDYINLSIELWNKLYEKLFGGFDDLALTCNEDEDEEDELEDVPKHMKTKTGGYLKDGFVIDNSDAEEESLYSSDEPVESEEIDGDDDIALEDIGSELSEESYVE